MMNATPGSTISVVVTLVGGNKEVAGVEETFEIVPEKTVDIIDEKDDEKSEERTEKEANEQSDVEKNENGKDGKGVSVEAETNVDVKQEEFYQIAVTCGTQTWEVKRTAEDFIALSIALGISESSNDNNFPTLTAEKSEINAEKLQVYLSATIDTLKENIWHREILIKFLDEAPNKSYLTQVQLSKMSKQIDYLLAKTAENEQKFIDIEAKAAKLDKIVELLTASYANKQVEARSLPTPPPVVASQAPQEQPASRIETIYSQQPISAKCSPVVAALPAPYAVSASDPLIGELEEERSHSPVTKLSLGEGVDEEDFDISLLDNLRLAVTANQTNQLADDEAIQLPRDFLVKWDPDAKPSDGLPAQHHEHLEQQSLEEAAKPPHTTGPSSKFVPKSPTDTQHYDTAIDEILDSIQPHETQISYRQSAVGLLKKQGRLSLNSTTYEVGLHALHCFLPSDPIKLSVVISKNQVPHWHTNMGERLKMLETGATTVDEAQFPDIYEDYKPMMTHAVRSVSFLNERDSFKVVCAVDALEVEISANARTDICMLAFLEEVAEMVGKDNLFKRSLLLIRAWWVYETASYVGCAIKHYLSDFSLCIMVCAIFNQYHSQIGSPLQALCLFLTEYSGYDGATHAITLHGIIPFKTPSAPQSTSGNARADHLINTQFIDKYRKLFNLQSAVDESITAAEDALNKNSKFQQPYYSIVNKNILNFTRFGFNVVHPFTSANMITEKLSTRRLQLIAKAFQIGAMNLSVVLKQSNDNMALSHELIHSYFPAVLSKFANDYRPDAINNSLTPSATFESQQFANPRDIMNISIDKIWQNILYCNFIIESIVSESAILTFFLDNLALKGPLPVGEIGKMLSDVSSIPNLSQKLKDKFGGLKKFLDRFQDLFVFSNDHPYNPHVILRNSLTPEQLLLLESGAPFPVPAAATPSLGTIGSKASVIAPAGGVIGAPKKISGFSPKLGGLGGDDDLSLSYDPNSAELGLFNTAAAPAKAFPSFTPAASAPGSNKFLSNYGAGTAAPGGSLVPNQLQGGYGGNLPMPADKKMLMQQKAPGQQGGLGAFSASSTPFNPSSQPFIPSGAAIGSKPKQQLGSAALLSPNDYLMEDFEYGSHGAHMPKSGGSSMLSQLRENTTELNLGGGAPVPSKLSLQQQKTMYEQQQQQQMGMGYGGSQQGGGYGGASMHQQQQYMEDHPHYGMKPPTPQHHQQQQQQFKQQQQQGRPQAGGPTNQQLYQQHLMQQQQQQGGGQQHSQYNNAFKGGYRN